MSTDQPRDELGRYAIADNAKRHLMRLDSKERLVILLIRKHGYNFKRIGSIMKARNWS